MTLKLMLPLRSSCKHRSLRISMASQLGKLFRASETASAQAHSAAAQVHYYSRLQQPRQAAALMSPCFSRLQQPHQEAALKIKRVHRDLTRVMSKLLLAIASPRKA